MSIAGGHHNAVRAAAAVGCEVFQVFTKSTNQWAAKPLLPADLDGFRSVLAELGVPAPVAHTSYLINLASPEDTLWRRSIDSLVLEVERTAALGATELVLHPGAHMGAGVEAGLDRVAAALRVVLDRTAGCGVWIDLEATAGQGTCLGCRFEHLGGIVDRLDRCDRVGVCLDSCHLFAAGYDFGTREQYNAMIAELEAQAVRDRVRVWHLNDSVRPLGSRVDRHAGIGCGAIGLEPFGFIVNDARFRHVPFILETPKGLHEGRELDMINLERLRGLVECHPEAPAAAGSTAQRRSDKRA